MHIILYFIMSCYIILRYAIISYNHLKLNHHVIAYDQPTVNVKGGKQEKDKKQENCLHCLLCHIISYHIISILHLIISCYIMIYNYNYIISYYIILYHIIYNYNYIISYYTSYYTL